MNQPQTHNHPLQNNQQISACSPSSVMEPVEDPDDCTMFPNSSGSGRVVAATQTHVNTNTNVVACDQLVPQTPVSLVPVNVPVPPVMYTVHRVVTTAQIQTAVGSTFASSASVSSVVSAARNDSSDCMTSAQVATAMSMSANEPCHSGLQITDMTGNIMNNASSMGPLTGVCSPTGNYLSSKPFCPLSPVLNYLLSDDDQVISRISCQFNKNATVIRTLNNRIPRYRNEYMEETHRRHSQMLLNPVRW